MLNLFLAPFRFLADAWLMFFALPWLMVLLVLGTVAQRYIGLYAAQKLFFGSFILWAGVVPLPGAYSVLGLIAGSLIAKLLLKSKLQWRRAGTLITHTSAIVLLAGGLISAIGRQEGYVVLGDGQSANLVSDYRQKEIAIKVGKDLVKNIAIADIKQGGDYFFYNLPFKIHIVRICFPCQLQARQKISDDLKGMAKKAELLQTAYSKEDGQNLMGIEFTTNNAGKAGGTYILFEGSDSSAIINTVDADYNFMLQPRQRPLPFDVKLRHFTKSDYPGTDEARAYQSEVTVTDEGLHWDSVIEMNQPLRYKGYTLYQSSFVTEGDKTLSVLAVVKNAGEWFPYISIAMLCAGLIVHILILLRKKPAI